MMWFRPGMRVAKARVRSLRHSVSEKRNTPSSLARSHPFFKLMLQARGLDVGHYHEGSFYPLPTLVRFADFLDLFDRATASGTGACRRWQQDAAPCSLAHPGSWYRDAGVANSSKFHPRRFGTAGRAAVHLPVPRGVLASRLRAEYRAAPCAAKQLAALLPQRRCVQNHHWQKTSRSLQRL